MLQGFDSFILALPAELLERFFLFLMIMCRFSGLLLSAPFFGSDTVPEKVKIGVTALFALCVTPLVPPPSPELVRWSQHLVGLVCLCAGEVAIGLLFGIAVSLFFAAVQFAGQLIGQQIGISLAGIIDPISNSNVSEVGQLKYMLAVGVFVAANLHLELVGVMHRSFELVPVGAAFAWPQVGEMLVRGLGGTMWQFGLRVALPVLLGLFLVSVGLGFLAKSVPEINVFIVGFGLEALVGLWLLYLALPLVVDLMREGMGEFLRNGAGLLTWARSG
jgi:flagellar biosynthesis protein FliR